jgi:hypothetical protein
VSPLTKPLCKKEKSVRNGALFFGGFESLNNQESKTTTVTEVLEVTKKMASRTSANEKPIALAYSFLFINYN